jgi:hypothetical protein
VFESFIETDMPGKNEHSLRVKMDIGIMQHIHTVLLQLSRGKSHMFILGDFVNNNKQ